MCPLVARHDRAEPVVAHLDCDQFRPAEPSRAHGKMRTTGRVVPDCGEQRVYVRLIAIRRSVHWRSQVCGEFLSRNSGATLRRKRSPHTDTAIHAHPAVV